MRFFQLRVILRNGSIGPFLIVVDVLLELGYARAEEFPSDIYI